MFNVGKLNFFRVGLLYALHAHWNLCLVQVLYHFAVGAEVEDERIVSLDPYAGDAYTSQREQFWRKKGGGIEV